jgi:hypothetical protein
MLAEKIQLHRQRIAIVAIDPVDVAALLEHLHHPVQLAAAALERSADVRLRHAVLPIDQQFEDIEPSSSAGAR